MQNGISFEAAASSSELRLRWWKRAPGIALAVALAGGCLYAQSQTPIAVTPFPISTYLALPRLPANVLGLLFGYGNRLQNPGSERVTIAGTFVDGAGTSNATVIAQIPDRVRIMISGSESKTLLFDGAQAKSSVSIAAGPDLDILESLTSDSVENFFYSSGGKAGVRFLGGRYRADGQTTPGYAGPYYDIYELVQPNAVRASGGAQQKLYYFDSVTGRFLKTRYKMQQNGQSVEVQTVYSGWTKTGGQSLPGSIERLENGKTVFSLTVQSATTAAGALDEVFSKP